MRAAEPNSPDAGLLYVDDGPVGTARRAQPAGGAAFSCLPRAGRGLTLFVCVCVQLHGALASPHRGSPPSLISLELHMCYVRCPSATCPLPCPPPHFEKHTLGDEQACVFAVRPEAASGGCLHACSSVTWFHLGYPLASLGLATEMVPSGLWLVLRNVYMPVCGLACSSPRTVPACYPSVPRSGLALAP